MDRQLKISWLELTKPLRPKRIVMWCDMIAVATSVHPGYNRFYSDVRGVRQLVHVRSDDLARAHRWPSAAMVRICCRLFIGRRRKTSRPRRSCHSHWDWNSKQRHRNHVAKGSFFRTCITGCWHDKISKFVYVAKDLFKVVLKSEVGQITCTDFSAILCKSTEGVQTRNSCLKYFLPFRYRSVNRKRMSPLCCQW